MPKSLFASVIASFVLALPLAAQPSPAPALGGDAPVRFEFETRRDADLTPHSRVFLRAGGRRPLVFSSTEEFQILQQKEWKESGVPPRALAACTSWFGGAGDELYVVRRGARLEVFRQEMDEESGPFPWKRWKSLPLAPSK